MIVSIPDTREAAAFQSIANGRRSVYFFQSTPIPNETIRWAIRLAMRAPNHYKTKPWRFHVYAGAGRELLADAFERGALSIGQDRARARAKIYAAPVTVVVACLHDPDHAKSLLHEDQFATAAAVENLLLALSAAGIGAIWGTGRLIETEAVRALVGLVNPVDRIIAAITVGYADPERPLPPRSEEELESVVHWHAE